MSANHPIFDILMSHSSISRKQELVEKFLANGGDINIQTDYGETFLSLSYQIITPANQSNNLLEFFNYLLDKGVNPNLCNKDGNSPLFFYAISKHAMSHLYISSLCNNGADINIVNNKGLTPLHVSLMWENIDNINTLLLFNPNINIKTSYKITPLEYVKNVNNKEMLSILKSYQTYQDLNSNTNITNNSNISKKIKI